MLKASISFLLPVGEDPLKQVRSRRQLGLVSVLCRAETPFDLERLSRVRPGLERD